MTVGERNRKIVELRNSGLHYVEIAKTLNMSLSQCRVIYMQYQHYGESIFDDCAKLSPVPKRLTGSDFERIRREENDRFAQESANCIAPWKLAEAVRITGVGQEITVRRLDEQLSKTVMVEGKYPRFLRTYSGEIYYWDDVVRGMHI